ncbi:3'(2'),5'-bisphosphate nucleotidase CysQ [Dactylosporangium vinaceum]|uniref:Inositol monophosphatase family protein n=1 Tax=Dactylosporangium vinaceum TaxID=53362 RepID=A0ABV5M1I6_9ACTN|nr:inositol monophosphatase family protein [Dactylosporangium vinaceum]UAB99213.1 3'(2'),5'-bisphosphate nucleotidase CysQ [Dactylosporangium vinaceum]
MELTPVIDVARDFGHRLLHQHWSPSNRLTDRTAMRAAATALDESIHAPLRAALSALRPGACWVEEPDERTPLDEGEWWAVDEVEGAVNLLHGRPEWCISIALLRAGSPALAVIYEPVPDRLFTAVAGAGAHLHTPATARPSVLNISPKLDFSDAIVETSQVGDEPEELQSRIGNAIGKLMSRALLVRTTIPTTFPLLAVATGRSDVFWQFAPATTGVAAATLIATEAGAQASDLTGTPWRPGAPSLLVTPPALHEPALKALADL